MSHEQRIEVLNLVQSILTHVTEARCTSEELENISRDEGLDDEHLEAEAYDWADALEAIERRVEEYLQTYFPEDNDESDA